MPSPAHQITSRSRRSSDSSASSLSPGAIAAVRREGNVAVLEDHLERATGGPGALVVLDGEAGIGKSSLVREVLQRSDVRDFQGFTGRAEGLQRRCPFAVMTAARGVDGVPARSRAARQLPNQVLQTWARVHAHRDDGRAG